MLPNNHLLPYYYLLKHWRGELGILLSCLVNGGMLGFVISYVPPILLFFGEIFLGIILAEFCHCNMLYEHKWVVPGMELIFWIIPMMLWTIWASVGCFRCGIRNISNKFSIVEKLGGFVIIIWSVVIVVSMVKISTPIIYSLNKPVNFY